MGKSRGKYTILSMAGTCGALSIFTKMRWKIWVKTVEDMLHYLSTTRCVLLLLNTIWPVGVLPTPNPHLIHSLILFLRKKSG
jgi:hypothetical protein